MTSRELAALLGISVGALRTARGRGHVPPAARIAGLGLRWRRRDIERWLDAKFAEAGR